MLRHRLSSTLRALIICLALDPGWATVHALSAGSLALTVLAYHQPAEARASTGSGGYTRPSGSFSSSGFGSSSRRPAIGGSGGYSRPSISGLTGGFGGSSASDRAISRRNSGQGFEAYQGSRTAPPSAAAPGSERWGEGWSSAPRRPEVAGPGY